MSEVMQCVDAMTPGIWHDSDYIASKVTMDWRRVIFALLKAESKGLIEIERPSCRMCNERNMYRRVERWRTTRKRPY